MSKAKCLKCLFYKVQCKYIVIGEIKHPIVEWECDKKLKPNECNSFQSRF